MSSEATPDVPPSDQRQQFEDAVKQLFPGMAGRLRRAEPDGYVNHTIHFAWMLWSARGVQEVPRG
jgi:hypothetical protein